MNNAIALKHSSHTAYPRKRVKREKAEPMTWKRQLQLHSERDANGREYPIGQPGYQSGCCPVCALSQLL